jgi:hypothetical protein
MSETLPFLNTSILEEFLNREDLSQQLHISTRTLDRWHALGIGPPRVCVGRTILYNIESVRDWLLSEERSRESRSSNLRTSCMPLRRSRIPRMTR